MKIYKEIGENKMSDDSQCTLCPRMCQVKRENQELGFCRMPEKITVSRAALHMWEEPCISGEEGSGAVFFSGCNLQCVYCQNKKIASGEVGIEISIEKLAEIFLNLQEKQANNINLVTPTHFIRPIKKALLLAKERGLILPVVYNTSGYELVESLKELDGLVDIYLPDFKYYDNAIAKKYSNVEDYFFYASCAVKEMVRQTKELVLDERGMMKKGVIVRHLVLPGCIEDSKRVIKYLYETYGNNIMFSIMNQYTPLEYVKDIPELNRKLTEEEYEELVNFAIDLGVENGYIQEGETAQESFIPAFDYEGII